MTKALLSDQISRYRKLSEELALSSPYREAGMRRLARIRLDRAMVEATMNCMGSTCPCIWPGDCFYDDSDVMPVVTERTIDALNSILKSRGTDASSMMSVALALLDDSASFVQGSGIKDAGAFYTPMRVADYITRRTLGSHLIRHVELLTGREHSGAEGLISDCGAEDLAELYDHLKKMRVLDSSCGSGIFLESALNEMYRLRQLLLAGYHKKTGEWLEAHEGAVVPEHELKLSIINENLYGVDIEKYSVECTRLRLLLLVAGSCGASLDPDRLKPNLKSANAIMPEAPAGNALCLSGQFDVIVGNPPYMRIKSMFSGQGMEDKSKAIKSLSKIILQSGLYRYQEGNLNLYKLFIERNLGLLGHGGSLGLIFPSSFLNEATSQQLRKHIFDTCRIEEIVEMPERSRTFTGVSQATAILICGKTGRTGTLTLSSGVHPELLGSAGVQSIRIDRSEVEEITDGRMEIPMLTSPDMEWHMIKRMRSFPPFKGDATAGTIGDVLVGHIDETINRSYISTDPTGDIFVKGIHLKEYYVDISPDGRQPRWSHKGEFLKARPSAADVVSLQRIIGRNTINKSCSRRLKFALLPPGYICGNSVKQIIIRDPAVLPGYLLALLNSAVLNWYFELFSEQNNVRNYHIENLPVPRANAGIQKVFSTVASLIQGSTADVREFLDHMLMDTMVYELYFCDAVNYCIIPIISSYETMDAMLPGTLMNDRDLARAIENIVEKDQFRLICKAAYKSDD